ncbi:MAG: TorF family putative porin, partial [Gammaproteobacteria bacterium]|nr:TorF family putative porin [Gammaproteobacteria bacterium]
MNQNNQAVRRLCVQAAATVCALAGPMAHADISRENFTGYATLTSDYRFRGLSQTNSDPALQLGIDFQHDSGIFAGLWGSNVDFAMDRFEEEARDVELNYYLGYHRSIGRDWAGVISVIRYAYPGASKNYDYTEISVGVNYVERLFATVAYSDDAYSLGGSATVYELAAQ